ncbi:GNAT family N-acetyltransferase [uncultured Tateyamaria sp.]|uniref:GNAT family N-acetyltransferase n=1 Tax=Tateyamaria sp. 1078 TaxID=3417464 RepID=UPI00262743F5|nr:GNAT family N-acetyltransferase [uncultured Tateyamaria sp.]
MTAWDCPASPAYDLRPATDADFDFARDLYLSSMKPLLIALDAWDADQIDAAFRGYFIAAEIRVVTVAGVDAGWIQVSQTHKELCLDQLHLIEEVRGQGIGTALIKAVIADATGQNKNVSLSLVRGNPAITLYRRLGFERTSEDDTKIHKRLTTGRAA